MGKSSGILKVFKPFLKSSSLKKGLDIPIIGMSILETMAVTSEPSAVKGDSVCRQENFGI